MKSTYLKTIMRAEIAVSFNRLWEEKDLSAKQLSDELAAFDLGFREGVVFAIQTGLKELHGAIE